MQWPNAQEAYTNMQLHSKQAKPCLVSRLEQARLINFLKKKNQPNVADELNKLSKWMNKCSSAT